MPPSLLFDISKFDLTRSIVDMTAIREVNPQRGDMEHLDGICWWSNDGEILGYKDVGDNEFWVAGHIPGRPLYPGVLMIESAAQLASFYVKAVLKWDGFIGFGGVESCKFRRPVTPNCRLHLLAKQTSSRHHRFTSNIQGLVAGLLVFEATITGTVM